MLNSEFSLRKFQNLNFHFMKQYSPNSNIIITTYPCIYLYIQQVYGFLLSSFLLCQFFVGFWSSFFAFYVLCILWQKSVVMFKRVVDLVDRGRVSLFEGYSEIFYAWYRYLLLVLFGFVTFYIHYALLIIYIYIYIYMIMMYVFHSYLTCVFSFLSLYTCFLFI